MMGCPGGRSPDLLVAQVVGAQVVGTLTCS